MGFFKNEKITYSVSMHGNDILCSACTSFSYDYDLVKSVRNLGYKETKNISSETCKAVCYTRWFSIAEGWSKSTAMNFCRNRVLIKRSKLQSKILELASKRFYTIASNIDNECIKNQTMQNTYDNRNKILTKYIVPEFQTEDPDRIKVGQIWRHFKGGYVTILGVCTHSETEEPLVIYNCEAGTYARPLKMFLSRVDHDKYPDCTQQYRFELIGLTSKEENCEHKICTN